MKKAVQRFLPSRNNEGYSPKTSFKKSLKLDSINLIEDFYIELSDPHKTWSPGETITGTATLELKKNITNINITLTLLGFIKLKQGTSPSTVRSKPAVLFTHTALIYGHDPNELPGGDEPIIGLSKGEHRFPFSMKLPRKNIYTSISFEKGSISYLLRASINHNQSSSPLSSLNSSPASIYSSSSTSTSSNIIPYSKTSIHHCEKNISIIVPINVAKIPKPSTKVAYLRISDKKLKKTLSSTSTVNSNYTNGSDQSNSSNENISPIKLSVDVPQSGYLRGELIPVKIKVSHYKPIQFSSGIVATLIRVCRLDNGPESPIQSFRKDLSQTVIPLYIDPESLQCEVSTSLRVPIDAFPTIIGSNTVSFQYYIEVLANVSNKNFIPNTTGNSNHHSGNSAKFSSSIVFDLDSSRDRDLIKNSSSGNGTDSFINVDKLKRSKNLLGLNTEIIVGTERTVKHKQNIGKQTIINNALVHNGGVNGDSTTHVIDPDISFEAISQTSVSPLSIDASGVQNGAITTTDNVLGNDVTDSCNITTNSIIGLSEKEILRINEEASMSSEQPAPSYTSTNSNFNQVSNPISSSAPLHAGIPFNGFDTLSSVQEIPSAPPISSSSISLTPSSPIDYSVQFPSNSTFTTSPTNQRHTVQSSNGTLEDKQELERRRLEDLESDPPEFDYVPEYNPSDPNQQKSNNHQDRNSSFSENDSLYQQQQQQQQQQEDLHSLNGSISGNGVNYSSGQGRQMSSSTTTTTGSTGELDTLRG